MNLASEINNYFTASVAAKKAASPTPWVAHGKCIHDCDGRLIGAFDRAEDAEMVVQCVNEAA